MRLQETHPTNATAAARGRAPHPSLLESWVVATSAQWLAGARPRTLPAAVAPVLAGTGVAAYVDAVVAWKALLALVVSLALQVAVNYANDYSDGIRGTDDDRVGPMRLVGSGAAPAAAVKRAAFAAFGVAGVAGLVLAATTAWWLVAVGLVCVVAAWYYTGGSTPYGYLGLGEVMVFVFFGLVAVIGTTYVQTESWEWPALYAGVGVGALACAILVANNLRDIPTDTVAGKRTLAVRLGADRTRGLYVLLVLAAALAVVAIAVATTWWVLVGLGFLAVGRPCRAHRAGRRRGPRPGAGAPADRSGRARLVGAGGRRPGAGGLISPTEQPGSGRTRGLPWGHDVPDLPGRGRRRVRGVADAGHPAGQDPGSAGEPHPAPDRPQAPLTPRCRVGLPADADPVSRCLPWRASPRPSPRPDGPARRPAGRRPRAVG